MILNPERRPLVVAEISANHNRSLERALRIVEAAAWAGWTPLSCRLTRPTP